MEIRQKTDRSLQFFIHMFPFAFRNGWFLHVRWQKDRPCLIILILSLFYLGKLRIKVWIKSGYFFYIFITILFWLYIHSFCLNYVWIKLGLHLDQQTWTGLKADSKSFTICASKYLVKVTQTMKHLICFLWFKFWFITLHSMFMIFLTMSRYTKNVAQRTEGPL